MTLHCLENENLLEEGKTTLDAEEVLNPSGRQAIPWIAKLLLGAGGWLTAIFLGAFTAMLMSDMFGSNEEEIAAIVGLFYLATSIGITRISNHPFLTQLTLAVGTAGIALTVFGLWDLGNFSNGLISVVVTLVLCAATYFVSRNGLLKYISILAVFITWWFFQLLDREGFDSSLPLSISAILAAAFLSGLIKTSFWRPALWGLISGLFFLLYLPLFPERYIENWQNFDVASLSTIIALGFGASLWTLTRPETMREMVAVILFTIFLCLITWFGTAGIAASLGVIVLAHARKDQSLKWFGILALAVFVIAFYYFLGKPLLSKSYLLMSTGVILLSITGGIRIFTKNPPVQS